ncbi:uncharacterized protein THITE_2114443 [Thermothielavioides terrestris NRRL 8126]|uniref:cyclin-dependent kinase n=1 Tax=Thermothielavioides terrestris (strain ATCC 38088 / NRRL 8126) TaxID=578455 RepID=G2QZP7_THETT|nr:uncharacterized protein THITE_2114443 [Thermothielavioides terrestris NRRL 8126]AEO66376.1 hypothetical protein THITE_2114443 [Thermothielavioides terrestris NRRL 8126]
MDSESDWRRSVTASERYDNIQRLAKAVAAAGLSQSAFSLESEAYKNANSREEYDAACSSLPSVTGQDLPPQPEPPDTDGQHSSPGITIGRFQSCHYIASGVTSAVYRSQAHALKVIVESHAIEPHNPHREAKILESLRATEPPNIIPLLETFRDREQRFVLVFPYQPFTLAHLLSRHHQTTAHAPRPFPTALTQPIITALFRALHHLHTQGIIHRDVKPSALLLSSAEPTSPSQIVLSDFGTAWHPTLSPPHEPAHHKILDVGTGPYRAPETLFGNRAYGPAVDLWAAGTTLAECLLAGSSKSKSTTNKPHRSAINDEDDGDDGSEGDGENSSSDNTAGRTLFASRAAHEDGNQLGLILSIFRTLGTPTPATWPEAAAFRTPPFEMYRVFPGRVATEGWEGVLPGAGAEWRELVAGLVRYESRERVTAGEALQFACLKGERVEGQNEGGL